MPLTRETLPELTDTEIEEIVTKVEKSKPWNGFLLSPALFLSKVYSRIIFTFMGIHLSCFLNYAFPEAFNQYSFVMKSGDYVYGYSPLIIIPFILFDLFFLYYSKDTLDILDVKQYAQKTLNIFKNQQKNVNFCLSRYLYFILSVPIYIIAIYFKAPFCIIYFYIFIYIFIKCFNFKYQKYHLNLYHNFKCKENFIDIHKYASHYWNINRYFYITAIIPIILTFIYLFDTSGMGNIFLNGQLFYKYYHNIIDSFDILSHFVFFTVFFWIFPIVLIHYSSQKLHIMKTGQILDQIHTLFKSRGYYDK